MATHPDWRTDVQQILDTVRAGLTGHLDANELDVLVGVAERLASLHAMRAVVDRLVHGLADHVAQLESRQVDDPPDAEAQQLLAGLRGYLQVLRSASASLAKSAVYAVNPECMREAEGLFNLVVDSFATDHQLLYAEIVPPAERKNGAKAERGH